MGVDLFKKTAALLLSMVFFSSFAYAGIYLIEPTETTLQNKESIELGNIAAGETFSLVAQKKSGLDFEWSSISVDGLTLPFGWAAATASKDKTLSVDISLPGNALESVQRITVVLSAGPESLYSESFSVYITVKRNLLEASMESLKQDSMVGKASHFKLVINNDSIARQTVSVSSTLPNYWFAPKTLSIEPLKTTEVELEVFPQSYGARHFEFTVSSELNSFSKTFPAEMNVFSTLKGKLSSPLFGFPIFTPSLLPFLLVDALLAFIS